MANYSETLLWVCAEGRKQGVEESPAHPHHCTESSSAQECLSVKKDQDVELPGLKEDCSNMQDTEDLCHCAM